MKNITIIGSSGGIGVEVLLDLNSKGYYVKTISRSDLDNYDILYSKLQFCDILINFSGTPIFKPWTKKNKKLNYESRIGVNRKLKQFFDKSGLRISQYISPSAIGIYQSDIEHDESSKLFANDYLSILVQNWEKSIFNLSPYIDNICVIRLGVVLNHNAGYLAHLTYFNFSKLLLGLGPKSLNYSVITIKDICNIIRQVIVSPYQGVINGVNNSPIMQHDLLAYTKKYYNFWFLIFFPSFLVKLIFPSQSALFLNDYKVYSKYPFNFEFEKLFDFFKS